MGQGYVFKCKCGYSFEPWLGVGIMFPMQYQELKEAAIKGDLGKEIKDFFAEHPEGAIDADTVVARCRKCGKYECVSNLSMYFPKDNTKKKEKGRWSVAMPFEGEDYVAPWDLQESYELYAKYPHKCEACGGDMDIISEEDLEQNGLICPICGKPIKYDPDDVIMWD